MKLNKHSTLEDTLSFSPAALSVFIQRTKINFVSFTLWNHQHTECNIPNGQGYMMFTVRKVAIFDTTSARKNFQSPDAYEMAHSKWAISYGPYDMVNAGILVVFNGK